MVNANNQNLIAIIGGIVVIVLLLTSVIFYAVINPHELNTLTKDNEKVINQTYQGASQNSKFKQNLYKNH